MILQIGTKKKIPNRRLRRLCVFGGFVLLGIGLLCAVAGNGYAQNSKRKDQLNFQIPEDWPIEKRGGLITPIPTEEYVSIKFKEIQEEFQTIREEFSEKITDLQSSLKNVEGDIIKETKKRQSESEPQTRPQENLTDILSNIESLKSDLRQIEERVTNKITDTQSRIETINSKLSRIGENLEDIQTQIYRIDEKVDFYHER